VREYRVPGYALYIDILGFQVAKNNRGSQGMFIWWPANEFFGP